MSASGVFISKNSLESKINLKEKNTRKIYADKKRKCILIKTYDFTADPFSIMYKEKHLYY